MISYQSSAHIEASILSVDNRHVEQGYVEPVPEDGHLELGFELRLIEARES